MASSANTNKPYVYWLHCNRCFEEHFKKLQPFFLLACQHVSCGKCLVEIKQDINGPRTYKCPICQKNTRACEINNTMPKNQKELFHPEPYLDGLNTYKIVKFQAVHRRHYLDYLENDEISLEQELQKTEKMKEDCKKTCQELQDLKAERKRLERRVIAIRKQRKRDNDNRQSKLFSSSSPSKSDSTSTGPTITLTSPESESIDVMDFLENNAFDNVNEFGCGNNSFFI